MLGKKKGYVVVVVASEEEINIINTVSNLFGICMHNLIKEEKIELRPLLILAIIYIEQPSIISELEDLVNYILGECVTTCGH